MPCFKPGQAFDEDVILGRLLTGYGELELGMCSCLIAVEGMFDRPIRTIFGRHQDRYFNGLMQHFIEASTDSQRVQQQIKSHRGRPSFMRRSCQIGSRYWNCGTDRERPTCAKQQPSSSHFSVGLPRPPPSHGLKIVRTIRMPWNQPCAHHRPLSVSQGRSHGARARSTARREGSCANFR
jgi:hypothetical protein